VDSLPSLEEGMFGYSLTRPIHNQDWYYGVFDACSKFRCDIEGWHTESGPGVYEAALEYGEIREMADRAALFKLTVKNISSKFGITPCFMAKPRQGLPGNSGHMHVSLVDKSSGANLFARESVDPNPPYEDVAHLSDLGRHFLAGLLEGLPDIMPIVAPTINSYKRLVENFWAPVTVSWGLEHRAASIRLIAPPTCPPKGTRFEIRVPGADTNGYLVLAAILALGWRGVEKKLELPIAPLARGQDVGGADDKGERLAKNLKEATARFVRKESIAREVFGDEFVEHFAGTREHEIRLWDEAVTDWYVLSSPNWYIRKPHANHFCLQGGQEVHRDRVNGFGHGFACFPSVISWRKFVADIVAIATSFRNFSVCEYCAFSGVACFIQFIVNPVH
jgi:glutamine synthetase